MKSNAGRVWVTAKPLTELAILSRKFRSPLIAFFSRRTGCLAEAEDLTQEVFVRLAQSKVDKVDSTDAFIFRIATNLLRDRGRRNRVRTNYLSSERQQGKINIDVLDPHRVAAARESLAGLLAAIQALPEPTQQIFILYRVENIDKHIIADSFGYNVRTVEKHISRALIILARRMRRRV